MSYPRHSRFLDYYQYSLMQDVAIATNDFESYLKYLQFNKNDVSIHPTVNNKETSTRDQETKSFRKSKIRRSVSFTIC